MGKSTDSFFEKKKDWSKIKDSILSCYLKPYFAKIKCTNKPIIYIDGFAGKGIFDDGQKGSPLIVYELVQELGFDIDVKYCFIEKKYAGELKNNCENLKNINIIDGNYEDNIVELIKSGIGKNVFVYIDPFGIKNMNFNYFKEMNSNFLNSVEFLMNLNSFGFFREGCRLLGVKCDVEDEFEDINVLSGIENMNAIAGGTYWQDIIQDYKKGNISAYEAEKLFSKQYCETIMNEGIFKYVINIPIRHKRGVAPKYRLVFGTNHIDGVKLMNDNMCNRFDSLNLIQGGGMCSLFSQNSENELITEEEIKNNILGILTLEEKEYNNVLFSYIKEYGITKTSTVNKALKELEKDNVIFIRREPPFTEETRKKSTFICCLRGKNCFIRK